MTDPTTVTSPASTTPKPLSEYDPRSVFGRAVGLGSSVIAAVSPDQIDDPTPCDGLDVRSLLGHLVEVLHRVAAIGRAENPFGTPPLPAVDDDAWLQTWREAAHEVQAAWTDDAVLQRIVVLPWSQLPAGETLGGYLNEVTVHTWDLAVATGQRPEWDPQVLSVAFDAIQGILPAADRAAIFAAAAAAAPEPLRGFPPPFAEAVEVAPTAPLIDRLVAWNGRDPQRLAATPLGASDRKV